MSKEAVNNQTRDTTLKLYWKDWGNSWTVSIRISPHDSLFCFFGLVHRTILKRSDLLQRASRHLQSTSELYSCKWRPEIFLIRHAKEDSYFQPMCSAVRKTLIVKKTPSDTHLNPLTPAPEYKSTCLYNVQRFPEQKLPGSQASPVCPTDIVVKINWS